MVLHVIITIVLKYTGLKYQKMRISYDHLFQNNTIEICLLIDELIQRKILQTICIYDSELHYYAANLNIFS